MPFHDARSICDRDDAVLRILWKMNIYSVSILSMLMKRLVALAVLVVLFLTVGFQPEQNNPEHHAFNLSKGFVISLRKSALPIAIREFLNVEDIEIINAINATEAVKVVELPLYTRMNMYSGRHDHMQISNGAMLGCLLSHMHVWKQISDGQTILVLEEDAIIDERSRSRLRNVYESMLGVPWDIIMLEAGHPTNTGKWLQIG